MVSQFLVYATAAFGLIGCTPLVPPPPYEPLADKPRLDAGPEGTAVIAAGTAVAQQMGKVVEDQLLITIVQNPECQRPLLVRELQVRLIKDSANPDERLHAVAADVPTLTFKMPVQGTAGRYNLELWNKRLALRLGKQGIDIGRDDAKVTVTSTFP